MLELLFEGRDLRVLGRRHGDIAVVTFSPLPEGAQPALFADRLLLKSGLTAVHVVARRKHWWQSREKEAATSVVRYFLKEHADRVTFGVSMGGYGALAWAADVGATRIVAVAPQTTLTGLLLPEWHAAIERHGIQRDAVADDMPAGLVPLLLYDPLSAVDHFHAQWLCARRKVSCVTAYGAGHSVLRGLRARGMTSASIAGILTDVLSAADLQAQLDDCCPDAFSRRPGQRAQ